MKQICCHSADWISVTKLKIQNITISNKSQNTKQCKHDKSSLFVDIVTPYHYAVRLVKTLAKEPNSGRLPELSKVQPCYSVDG